MIVDCIGCLHGSYPKLERGDLLIVTGDLTARDTKSQYIDFLCAVRLYSKYSKIIIIAGNHDNLMQNDPSFFPSADRVSYLCDSGTVFWEPLNLDFDLDKIFLRPKIWGSPWTKTFEGMNPKCKAFTVDTEEELAIKFSLIPEDTEILITHSPPYGILDGIPIEDGSLFHVGSKSLADRIPHLKNLKLHVFSHIHEGYGHEIIRGIHFVNCSHMTAEYKPINNPIRIEL